MVIWTGQGYAIAFVWIGCVFLFTEILGTGTDHLALLIGAVFGSALVTMLDRILTSRGHDFQIHSLFFIPIRDWVFLLPVISLIVCVLHWTDVIDADSWF